MATETRLEKEKAYFARGREVLGKNAGGLLTNLLKARQQDLDEAMKVLETAALAFDPREYVAGCCKYVPRHKEEKPVSSTVREKQEIAAKCGRHYAHAASRQWHEWDRYLRSQGKSGAIRDRDGGWWFPSEWPPQIGAA